MASVTQVSELTQLSFPRAAQAWLESRRPYLAAETQRNYAVYIRSLSAFFGDMRLHEIKSDDVRAYQLQRMAKAGPSIINKECSVLQQMRKRIGLPLHDYQPLPISNESRGRALTDAEYERLFAAAQLSPEWVSAFCFAQISVNTGGGPKEVLGVRLKDINLENRLIYFPRTAVKNDYRVAGSASECDGL